MLRDYFPTIVVLVAFLSCLGVYASLRLVGTDAGVMDELLLLVGGGLAGVAAPGLVGGGVGK